MAKYAFYKVYVEVPDDWDDPEYDRLLDRVSEHFRQTPNWIEHELCDFGDY